jgi:hypothetical protein
MFSGWHCRRVPAKEVFGTCEAKSKTPFAKMGDFNLD